MSDIPDLLIAPLLDKIREKLLEQRPSNDTEYSEFPDRIKPDLAIAVLAGLSAVAAAHPDAAISKRENRKGLGPKIMAPLMSLAREKLQELRPSTDAEYSKIPDHIKQFACVKVAFVVAGLSAANASIASAGSPASVPTPAEIPAIGSSLRSVYITPKSSGPESVPPAAAAQAAVRLLQPPVNELDRIRSACMLTKQPYNDPEFPPQASSLIPDWDHPSEEGQAAQWKDIVWKRASSLDCLNKDGQMCVFQGAIEPADIKQGALGNCYFLSALSVLAELPERIRFASRTSCISLNLTNSKFRNLFVSDQVTPEGVYGIRMFLNGCEETVIIDDHIPCKRNQPYFSHAHGQEIWVILLEKAWAKVHGNYDRIIGGTSSNTLRDLTGAPAYSLKTSEEGLWETILAADQANHCMAAGAFAQL
jgi:hypothetical protein